MTDEIKKTSKANFVLGLFGCFAIISLTLSIVLWLFPSVANDMNYPIGKLLKLPLFLSFDVQQVALLSTIVFVVLIFYVQKKIKKNAIHIFLIIICLLLVRISFELKQYLTYEGGRYRTPYLKNL